MQALAYALESSTRSSGILFLEDFEGPEAPQATEPVLMPPSFTDADVAQARAEAHAAGYEQGLARARDDCAQATRRAVEAIAGAIRAASDTAARAAEANADALAHLLLGVLGTLLPTLRDRFAGQEAAALAVALCPGLCRQAMVRVRAHPQTRPDLERAVSESLRQLDTELCGRLSFADAPAVAAGDVRLEWESGAAARTTEETWAEVAAVLRQLGLLGADAAAPAQVA